MNARLSIVLLALVTTMSTPLWAKGAVKDLYQSHCASCHGKDLKGGSGSSLIDDQWKYGASDAAIAKVIREGVKDMGMPAWRAALDDNQIRSLVIFIREQQRRAEDETVLFALSPKQGVIEAQGYRFRLQEVTEVDGKLWSVAFMPDSSALMTERNGTLWHFKKGKLHKIKGTPKVWQQGQGGLLEVALHPDYKKNGWIYLSYSENKGGKENDKDAGMTAVVRGKIKKGKWLRQETIFSADASLHTASGAHFGSRFVFDKGYLYFGIGDRGRMHQAQDLSRPNGKIHRLHDDGRIPKDNPFVNTENALPSIWSYGHRNPQGTVLHPGTGVIWASEHGPRGGDEINVIAKGKNYGWPVITYGMNYDGTPITHLTHKEGMEQPKLYWVPSIAVAGIEFYDGDLFPQWKGRLLAGGMGSRELHLLTIEGEEIVSDDIILADQGRIRDVANGPDGAIYLLLNGKTPNRGVLARLVPVK